MGFWTRLWDSVDRVVTSIVGGDEGALEKRKRKRRQRRERPPVFDPERESDELAPGDDETPYARAYIEDISATIQVIAWTGPGGLSDWRSIEGGDVPTRDEIEDADLLTIAIEYDDGEVVYRTFKGPTADIRRIIDDWIRIGSL